MATIGTFTKTENGFTGAVKTLTLNVKAKLTPAEGENERGPEFRIFAGATEFGAAWKKTARESGREYISVKLDDPSFPAPIYATLKTPSAWPWSYPPKPAEQPSSPAVQRLDRHFAETHQSPEAARESFLQMYRESPRLAVWAANNHPQVFGETTGVGPTGRVTGRGLREVLGQKPPAATPDPRQAAMIAHDT